MKIIIRPEFTERGGHLYSKDVYNALYPLAQRQSISKNDIYYYDKSYVPQNGKKYLWTVHHWQNNYTHYNFDRVIKVVTVSQYWATFLKKTYNVDSTIIHNCYHEDAIQKVRNKDRQSLRDKFGFTDDKVYIYTGLCALGKGIPELIELLKIPNAIIVTSGKKFMEINTLHFKLEHQDYLDLLKACDIGVFNSIYLEGWHRVAMECCLVGTPALIKDNAGMGDLLRMSGQMKLDIDNINEQIPVVLADKEKYTELGWNGLKHLTYTNFKQQWLDLYNELNK